MAFPIDMNLNSFGPYPDQLVERTGFNRNARLEAGPQALGVDSRDEQFGSILSNAVENMQQRQNKATELGIRAVTGHLDDVHDYTIAASEAKLTIELTSAVRNKAVDAFNEIMRMQA